MRSHDVAARKQELQANPFLRLILPLDELPISRIKELIPEVAGYVGGYSFSLRTYNDYGPSIINTIEKSHPRAECLFNLRIDQPKNYSHVLQNIIKRPSIRYVTVNSAFFIKNPDISVNIIHGSSIDLLGTVEYQTDAYRRITDLRNLFSRGFHAYVVKNKNELNLLKSVVPHAFVIAQRVGRIQDKGVMVRKPEIDIDAELRYGDELLADIIEIHPAYTKLRTDYVIQALHIFHQYMLLSDNKQMYEKAV